MQRTNAFFVVMLGVALAAPAASGFAGGATGGNRKCNDCHTGGTAPTVHLTGPTLLVGGVTGTYEVEVISSASMVQKHAGLNVSAPAGTFAPKAGAMPALKVADGEITQTSTAGPSTTPIKFQLEWTAPLTPGPVTLTATGLSANGDGDKTVDRAAEATLTVDVAPSNADLAGLDFAPARDMTPPADEMRWGCGCRMKPRGGASADIRDAAALAILGLIVAAAARGRRFPRRRP